MGLLLIQRNQCEAPGDVSQRWHASRTQSARSWNGTFASRTPTFGKVMMLALSRRQRDVKAICARTSLPPPLRTFTPPLKPFI